MDASLTTFSDIVGRLHEFDEEPFDGQAPAIYVADPWGPSSQALVTWSGYKGGIPEHRTPLLYYLITVREALLFFGADYEFEIERGEAAALCTKLAHHITQRNAQRLRRTK